MDEAHLIGYLNEFVFRFNRRRSRSRGLVFYRVLELAVGHEPVRYQDLIANRQAGRCRLRLRRHAGIRPAWSALQRTDRGERFIRAPPLKWIPLTAVMSQSA